MTKSFIRKFCPLVVAALFAASNLRAQIPGGASTGLNNAAIIKLFGPNTSFTSQVEIKSLNKAQKVTTTMPLNFSMLEGKIRMEVDMNKLKSSEQPDPALAYARQLGMDQMVAVIRADKKKDLLIYPKTGSFAEVAMTKEEAADMEKKYTLTQNKVGKETLNGHACTKSNVTLTGEKGDKQEFVVWNATDLKDFPVQIQIPGPEDTVVMSFSEVKLIKADAGLFEAPTGMTKYDTAEKLVRALVAKSTAEKK